LVTRDLVMDVLNVEKRVGKDHGIFCTEVNRDILITVMLLDSEFR